MRSFRWEESAQLSLSERFPTELAPIAGGAQWQEGASRFGAMTKAEMHSWIKDLFGIATVPLQCPRVFISHRQCDSKLALRVACEAHLTGFDYWLDVVDLAQDRPSFVTALESRLTRKLDDFELGILTAAIIEMALLNSTHMIAVMTGSTAGSQWVPYEYGRAKQRMPSAENVACWRDRSLAPKILPEYLHLSPVYAKRSDLVTWLLARRAKYQRCSSASREVWRGSPPKLLPK
jgi:hypothetical protein